jgi:hypothetical protein
MPLDPLRLIQTTDTAALRAPRQQGGALQKILDSPVITARAAVAAAEDGGAPLQISDCRAISVGRSMDVGCSMLDVGCFPSFLFDWLCAELGGVHALRGLAEGKAAL